MAAASDENGRSGVRIGFAEFELFPTKRRLLRNGQEVRIGGRALDILSVLVERPGQLVSTRDLIESVWAGVHVGDSSLRVHMSELRRTLGTDETGGQFIRNVAGRGYTFVGDVHRLAPRQNTGLPRNEREVHGRDFIVADITGLIVPGRLVSLVAGGGMGKTTVARECVIAMRNSWPAGEFWIDMTTAGNRHGAIAQIALTLGLTPTSDDPLSEIADWLASREALLVLDCCEPVARTVREIVDRLLEEAPGTAILATSREVLGALRELVLDLPPLPTPSTPNGMTREAALQYAAVRMFADRGAEACAFTLTDDNAEAVVRICSGLDGIPLAIEIAAAQLAVFGVRDLEVAIAAQLRLGPNLTPGVEARHSSLTDMLSWSFELLSDHEKALFERLSVFEGAASLEAIRHVVPDSGLPENEMLVLLTVLGRKSLLKVDPLGDQNGFRLLDTTRAFAAEMLQQRGLERELRTRHALYLLQCAAASRVEGQVSVAMQWFGPHAPNLPNLRAALAWAFADEHGTGIGVSLAAAAVPLLMQLSLLSESERWAEAGLRQIPPGDFAPERVKLLAYRGAAMLGTHGPVDASANAMEQALQAAETQGDGNFVRLARSALFWLNIYRGEPTKAIAQARLLGTSAAGAPDQTTDLVAANCIASASTFLGDHVASFGLLTAVERRQPVVETGRFMRIGSDPGIFSRVFMIKTLWMLGRPEEAERLYGQILPNLRIPEHGLYQCYCLNEVMIPMLCQRGHWDDVRRMAADLVDASARQAMAIRRNSAESAALAVEILSGGGEIATFEQSLQVLRAARMQCLMPWLEWVLALGLTRSGATGPALRVLEGAILAAQETGAGWWLPELLRTKGEILAGSDGGSAETAAVLRDARALAHEQSALLLEIRAAATCVAYEGKPALDSLKAALSCLTEGFDDPDVRSARGLLDGD